MRVVVDQIADQEGRAGRAIARAFQGVARVVNALDNNNFMAPKRDLVRVNFRWAEHIGAAALDARVGRLIRRQRR